MPSCHHGSVATAAAVEENADAEAIDAACICYVNLPSPFVIGKSEQRSVELKKQAPAVLPDVYFIKAERIVTTTTLAAVRSVTPIYLSRELTFTPSRAPPRL